MAISVKIPTQLRSATQGESLAKVDGSTVGEVLDALYERYAELRTRIAEDGGLRRFVNVYVEGEDIRFLDGLDTSVKDGDEVTILPAVAGGSADADPLGDSLRESSGGSDGG
jgi:sulfur-carrier protein